MRPALALALILAACSSAPPGPPKLETGISSNNGGGDQVVGTHPSVGVTTRVQ